ncbi:MAG TPA: RNA polymerase sigma factor [Geobacteraceae bacterium]
MSDERQHISDEDAAMVASWRRGEISSFEALVTKYQKRIFNIAFRIIGDYEDACEVTQDTFVAAYRGVDSFRGEARFLTWLTSIVLNLSRNRLQQIRTRRRNENNSLDGPADGNDNGPLHERPSPAPSALEQLERRAVHEKLKECIRALSADFMEAIVLRDLHDYSYDDMCAILQVREGTLKSRLFRAREQVKECLKKAMGDL